MRPRLRPNVSYEEIADLLDLDKDTGRLYWRQRRPEMFTKERLCRTWNKNFAGKEAFNTDNCDGYLTGAILGRRYLAHRIVWLLFYKEWPAQQVDHIDGDRTNNRISNLRDVSPSTNSRNQKKHSNNTSGVTGVLWSKQERRWLAKVGRTCLGGSKIFAEAVAIRKRAEVDLGFHPNHGVRT